jgi:hypothetical protein
VLLFSGWCRNKEAVLTGSFMMGSDFSRTPAQGDSGMFADFAIPGRMYIPASLHGNVL